jgi:hypothetical protein
MHGLPKDFPHASLVGAKLIQLCLGENDLQLHFDNRSSLFIESSIRLRGTAYSEFRKAAASLADLLGREISESKSEGNSCLALSFGSDVLEIFDDSKHYESFVFKSDGRDFIV